MTSSAGLFPSQPRPSVSLLLSWLEQNRVYLSDAVEIYESENGWGVRATRDIDFDGLLLSVPKTAVLSARTTSLDLPRELIDPIPGGDWARTATTNLTVPTLALILLHEIRLGAAGKYWRYVQSLPREVEGLPIFWEEDLEARKWLRGTEADRELLKRKETGMGLEELKRFYETTKHLLLPTPTHQSPSPIESYLYAYSLISTRAFLIDIYHTLALVPFADILNHSSSPHTSLASDDFVCHICGSLPSCGHDQGEIPKRLKHVDPIARGVMEREVDSVDMRSEREVGKGNEVFNSYGRGIGDGRLLVEWGFVEGEFAGHGLEWTVDEVFANAESSENGLENTKAVWEEIVRRRAVALELYPDDDIHEDGEKLICSPVDDNDGSTPVLNLNHNGQISLIIWIAIYLSQRPAPTSATATLETELVNSVNALEMANISPNPTLDPNITNTCRRIVSLLKRRREGMYRPEIPMGELLDLRDALPVEKRDENMAMTLSIDERAVLLSALDQWEGLLSRVKVVG